MRRSLSILAAVAIAVSMAGEALAKDQCKDPATGKFIKCPPPAAAPATPAATKCRDSKTKKFVKCGTKGSEPVPTSGTAATSPTVPSHPN